MLIVRHLDRFASSVLAVVAFAETVVAGSGRADGYDLLRAALAAATVLALLVRRSQPGVMVLWMAAAMTLESLITESPDEIAVLVAVVVAAYSVAAHSGRREAVLGLGVLSLAIAITITVDPSDDLANIAPTLLLFVVLPGGFGFAWHRGSRVARDLADRVEAAERALEAERAGVVRQPAAAMRLTARQRDVVLLVARGFSNLEIATALHLSENTIKGYVSEILAEHGLRDRTQLAIRAFESGLVAAPLAHEASSGPG